MQELKEAVQAQEEEKPTAEIAALQERVEEEFGDLVFSMINYARFLNVDAENALERTNKKFISRFRKMEEEATKGGKKLAEMTLAEMDAIWNRIKHLSTS